MIIIDSAKCTNCGFCIDECPNYVLSSNSDSGETEIRYPDQCCICGHCVAICPENAINYKEIPSQKFEDLADIKILPENMKNFLLSRRSIRSFKEKAIPRELLKQLIETGIHAVGTSVDQQFNAIFIKFVPVPLDIIVPHLADNNPDNDSRFFGWNCFRILWKIACTNQKKKGYKCEW